MMNDDETNEKKSLLDVNQSNGTNNLDSESKLSSRLAAGWHNGLKIKLHNNIF